MIVTKWNYNQQSDLDNIWNRKLYNTNLPFHKKLVKIIYMELD